MFSLSFIAASKLSHLLLQLLAENTIYKDKTMSISQY